METGVQSSLVETGSKGIDLVLYNGTVGFDDPGLFPHSCPLSAPGAKHLKISVLGECSAPLLYVSVRNRRLTGTVAVAQSLSAEVLTDVG
jgi:hypothetical protein